MEQGQNHNMRQTRPMHEELSNRFHISRHLAFGRVSGKFHGLLKRSPRLEVPRRLRGVSLKALRVSRDVPGTHGLLGYCRSLAFGLWLISLTVTSAGGIVSVSPGSVVAWGENRQGETSPPLGLTNVVAACGAIRHSLALNADGTVTGFGQTANLFPNPLSNVVGIAAGTLHSVALRADGTVVAAGRLSATNVPAGLSNVVAVAAGDRHTLALRENGTVVAWGSLSSGLTNFIASLSNVIAISSGPFHSLALKKDGTVVGWGLNDFGQISSPAGISNVIAIAAGGYHSLALTEDRQLHGWGRNLEGQLNIPSSLSNIVSICAGELYSMALTTDGQIVAWGGNEFGQTNVPAYLHGQTLSIAAGYHHALAISRGPVIIRNPVSQTVPAGTNVQFNATASGIGPLSYQWQFNGTDLPGETNDVLLLNDVQNPDSGDYTIVVTNFAGAASNTAVLIVPIPPEIVAQPLSQTVIVGSDVTLSVSATGFPAPAFQWRWNGSNLAGATNSSLTLTNVQRSHQGNYQVIVTNAGGPVTSTNATLTVLKQASIPPEGIAQSYNTDAGFSFKLRLQIGADYRIQRSTDLIHWNDVSNFTCALTEMVFKDATAPSGQAFYRIASP